MNPRFVLPLLLAVAGLFLAAAGCTPWSCDLTSCADGCCTADGVCIVQTGDDLQYSCGLGAQQCVSCDYGQSCVSGVCQKDHCSAANCKGCCQNDVCVSGVTSTQCGGSGAACQDCQSKGQSCAPNGDYTAGSCQSCQSTCKGCCTSTGVCMNGNAAYACGSGGESCFSCRSGYSCYAFSSGAECS